jgi:hypothetical protein
MKKGWHFRGITEAHGRRIAERQKEYLAPDKITRGHGQKPPHHVASDNLATMQGRRKQETGTFPARIHFPVRKVKLPYVFHVNIDNPLLNLCHFYSPHYYML